MDLVLLSISWAMTLLSGIWVGIGVASAVAGRLIVNPSRTRWSRDETELLAVDTIVQGLGFAIYALIGDFIFTTHVTPFWAGHPWGIFISAPFLVFFLATQGFQAYVAYRHQQRGKRSAGEEPSR
ncbi:MAG TPA: hypothetical protein VGX22_13335 [Candidatus Dormibacteraeota bacterium]|nr:hypothetical protein [Candidatus Dormibacteraeota bacterium]